MARGKKEAPKVRAKLIEIEKRDIPIDKNKDKEVYWNGDDNLYPNRIEGLILQSPTASRGSKIMQKFIAGRGVENEAGEVVDHSQLPIVNSKKGYKITDIIDMAASDIVNQSGVWFHIGYGFDEQLNIVPKNIDVLPYVKCRKYKDDDDGNSGKIYLKDFEKKESAIGGAKEVERSFYPFNTDQEVIKAQIKADAGVDEFNPDDIKKYSGQVYYLNLTPKYKYSLSRFDAVYNDMDTEARIAIYANMQSRRGFLGKTIFLTAGLDPEKGKEVEEELQSFMGSEGAADMYYMEVEYSDNLDNILKTIQLAPQFDDKLFEVTQKRIRTNILGVINNIPEQLVFAGDGALFGTNPELYESLKKMYTEQVREEQDALEKALRTIGFPVKIKPLVEEQAAAISDKQADAQAALKGSVGGVTALIQLQQAVSQGFTTRGAAIAIIENIYGIDTETAIKMIGDPIETPITETITTDEV